MKPPEKMVLFVADDDPLFLKFMEIEFSRDDEFSFQFFPTGEALIENIWVRPNMIILDYHMNSVDKEAMNGLKILSSIKSYDSTIPVIMLSSQDSIEVAIDCTHHGAFDYIVKSETAFFRLRKSILSFVLFKKAERKWNDE